ncbi:beta-ketoacyl-[acyl-carrier-protein] synthase family protein [Paenibacillaceae bacterium WGS1546]|uniref:beta-ketoacyl-[acyl-carrier-protein] synthase family protein n=1 Tax=Cohnella sp. WGS1546 TaxID=3366810 RepID=UPI00372D29D7
MSIRVAVTGYGLITPFGKGERVALQAIYEGRHAFRDIRGFDTSRTFAKRGAEAPLADRSYRDFADYCVREAMRMAKLSPGHELMSDAAVAVGNLGDGAIQEAYYRQYAGDSQAERLPGDRGHNRPTDGGQPAALRESFSGGWCGQPISIRDSIPSRHADEIARTIGSSGVRLAYTNACVASANAIGYGYDQIRFGRTSCAIVGGINVIHPKVYYNFDSSRAMADDVVRPFSKDRSGLLIGDGAAILVLESLDAALRRGARPLAEIVGWGVSSDGFHVSQPDPEGRGLARAMRMALRKAGLAPQHIHYVNAHGTGTPLNDRSETKALKEVFGRDAGNVPVSSTKSMTGHMLEATGAVEAAFSMMALLSQRIPPTANYAGPEEGLDLDYVTEGARDIPLTYVMSNSSAFGGNNCSLIFRRVG